MFVYFLFFSFSWKEISWCVRSITADNFYQTSIYYSEKCLKFSVEFSIGILTIPLYTTETQWKSGVWFLWELCENFVILKLFKSYSKYTLSKSFFSLFRSEVCGKESTFQTAKRYYGGNYNNFKSSTNIWVWWNIKVFGYGPPI